MNILQLCTKSPYPPHDGGSMAMYSHTRCFVLLGHNVTVLTMCTNKHSMSEDDKAWLSSFTRLYTVAVNTSVNLLHLVFNFIFSHMPYNAVRFISPAYKRQLVSILKSDTFDLVQLEGLYLVPYINVIRRHSEALIALRAHNVEHELWERIAQTETHTLKKYYFTSLASRIANFETAALNLYDLLVPITPRDLEQFHSMGNQKPARVCPAGLDPDALAEQVVPPFQAALFFLGSLEWKPNQDALLWFVQHVFPKIRNRYPELLLHIAGRNTPTWLPRVLAKPGVVFHGEVPDARDFIREHGIMVAPCFSGGGMRVKIIEGMYTGKPVVTTTIGAEGLEARHGEHILIADTADGFADELISLLNNPEYFRKIGHNALNFIRLHFDNLKVAGELTDFYLEHLP